MTDKPNAPKSPDRGASDPAAAKRPHATIDLKAKEIKTPDPAPTAAGAASGSTGSGDAAAKVAAAAPDLKSRPDKAAGTDAKAEAEAKASAGGKAAAAPTPQRPARQGSGFGRFLTHLAAGVVGGVVALAAADQILPLVGLDPRAVGKPQAVMAPELTQRLAALETAVRERPAAAPDAQRQQAALDGAMGQVDELKKQVAGLLDAQGKLAAEAATLREAQAKAASPGADAERLARLEEQLNAMTQAAAADPARAGRLPQLAQLTGKVADLETALTSRLSALRKEVSTDVEARLQAGVEASEAARSGTQRLDREMTQLKSEATRLGQRADQLKAGADRSEQLLRTAQEDVAALKVALDGLKGDIEQRLKAAAKPADVTAAIAPVTQKIAALEGSVQGIVTAEADRKANAERIVLSLELGNLKRAVDRGARYTDELAEVRKVAGSRVDLKPLEPYARDGLATLADITREFRGVANAVLDADQEKADAGVVDRFLSGAKSIVRVRKTSHAPGDTSTEASLGRLEVALKENRLGDALAEAKKLPAHAAEPARAWLRKVEARQAVDAAITAIDAALKSSLGAGPAAPAQKGAQQ